MRIWNLQITRLRKDALGRKMHPWELITMDQLPEEGRQLIAKIARAACRDHLEEMTENYIAERLNQLCEVDQSITIKPRSEATS